MADDIVQFKLIGLDKVQKALEDLPRNVAKKGLRASLKAGATIMENGFVENAPKDTGFLSEHFGTRLSVKGNDISGAAFIGPEGKIDYPDVQGGYREKISSKTGKKYNLGRISVASVVRFLEFGTTRMPKNAFMTRTWEKLRDASLDAIVKKLRSFVEAEAKKSG
jgi:HK97 gp10 family phage protein